MCFKINDIRLPLIVLAALNAVQVSASTVDLSPSENVQSVVNAHSAGTTYVFTAGVYRLQSITPKAGDSYIGNSGAILNGSQLATSFSQQKVNGVTYWVTAGPSKAGTVAGTCDSVHTMCAYPEDLFINNQVIERVSSLSAVTSTTCYFDYSNSGIYFLTNPTGRTVEVGTTPHAFSATVSNVTIKNLTIEKYAAPAETGAIVARTGWTISNNTVAYNHGGGIQIGSNSVIESNYVHHNGQVGITGGDGSGALIQNNEVAYNNTVGFDFSWQAGGIYYANSTGVVIKGNYVHDNSGMGIHLDYQAYDWLIQGNRTQNNEFTGIDNEIGYNGTASYNISQNDGSWPGKTNPSMWWGCGIYAYAASNTTIYNNTVLNDTNGICGISIPRGSGNRGEFEVQNLSVSDNVIVLSTGAATGAMAQTGDAVYSSSANNHWTGNTYKLPSSTASSYVWNNKKVDASTWQSYGNDTSGTWISSTDTSFPSTAFSANETVATVGTTNVYSLPTTTSTVVKSEATGTQGTITKVAGPILTSGVWWWNVSFTGGSVGWCKESSLQK
jgi:parallel beta-helix repeat protein